MAAEREPSTAADLLVTALSPALIMLMVGSLVFFLVEVLYAGQYSERLIYTLFFFVLAAVLIARISIEMDAARASMYGIALAVVTFLALLSYVEYPGGGWLKSFGWLVNLGLMALIWWSAHKLTWDCTNIDEKRKGGGRGLLSAAGLDADAKTDDAAPASPPPDRAAKSAGKKKKKRDKHESALWNWIENYQKYRDVERKGPHTPGVWVIYFALAALPLFALGQSLIEPEDGDRRHKTFLQMAVYVGSALALLVTTSYLGLRRYLRQRKAKVPAAMTASWLGFGALLIVVFLALGAFLPRPHSEVPWFGISRAGKSEREASRYALNRDSAGKGEGARGEKTKAGDGDATGKNGQPGGGGKGDKGGGGKGDKGSGGKGQKGNSSADKNGKSDGGKSGSKESKDSESRDKNDNEKSGADAEKKDDEKDSDGNGKTESENDSEKEKAEGKDGRRDTSDSSPRLGGVLDKVANVLKWIVYAIVAILVVVGVALAILRYLAPFTSWAQRLLDALRNWWAGLFGRKVAATKKEAAAAAPVGPVRPPPFHEFPNPFADGSADRREPAELTDYTFLALDAWAWDRDCGRDATETPLEFTARLGQEFPDLADILAQFVKLYTRVTYSEYPLPDTTLAVLEQTWEGMVHGVAVA